MLGPWRTAPDSCLVLSSLHHTVTNACLITRSRYPGGCLLHIAALGVRLFGETQTRNNYMTEGPSSAGLPTPCPPITAAHLRVSCANTYTCTSFPGAFHCSMPQALLPNLRALKRTNPRPQTLNYENRAAEAKKRLPLKWRT